MEKLNTISERLAYIETVTQKIDGKPYSWHELNLRVDGRDTNLRIWIGNEKSIADGCGRAMIHLRLDKHQNYDCPLTVEKVGYLKGTKHEQLLTEIANQFPFGQIEATAENLNKLLELTKELKVVEKNMW
jgi:hypothetical protein